MLELGCETVGLVGFGKSNEAMYRYLRKNGYSPVIRCDRECPVPKGAVAIFGDGYLDTKEDVVFRSPGVRRDKIRGERVYTEAIYALGKMQGRKIGVTEGGEIKIGVSSAPRLALGIGKIAHRTVGEQLQHQCRHRQQQMHPPFFHHRASSHSSVFSITQTFAKSKCEASSQTLGCGFSHNSFTFSHFLLKNTKICN